MIAKKVFRRTRPSKAADYRALQGLVSRLCERIEELTDENLRLTVDLSTTRDRFVELMDVRGLLDGYSGLEDHDGLLAWRDGALQRVLDAADVRNGDEMGDGRYGDRALCPLCRRSANGSRRVRGFAFPEGLRRHLLGESIPRQCEVFAAADNSIVRRIRAKFVRTGHS
jgi:hypothetical protein